MSKYQDRNIQIFLQLLHSERIPIFCNVTSSKLTFQACSWQDYWKIESKETSMMEEFFAFREIFNDYVKSEFSVNKRDQYCVSYWKLLRKILSAYNENPDDSRDILSAAIGFGTFGAGFSVQEPLAAITFNLLHPVYQTAKIKSNLETPLFLPISWVHNPNLSSTAKAQMPFYHYRQLAFHGKYKNARFLLSPPVEIQDRFLGFEVIHSFSNQIHNKKDPYFASRASYLAKILVLKLRLRQKNVPIRILDIGGGTGHLFYKTIQIIADTCPDILAENALEWTILERPGINYKHLVMNRDFFKKIHKVRYIRKSFEEWIQDISKEHFDFILACRLFDNFSNFSIEYTNSHNLLSRFFKKPVDVDLGRLDYINPMFSIAYPQNLHCSSSKFMLEGKSVIKQPSFSDFFQGLYLLMHPDMFSKSSDVLFYPFRELQEKSLTLCDGTSIFKPLLEKGTYVLIEDVDLKFDQLQSHLIQHKLDCYIENFTKTFRLSNSNIFLLSTPSSNADFPSCS